MRNIRNIAIDVDDVLCGFVSNAGAIGLADRARSDHDDQFRIPHRIVAADRPFRSADMHVARILVGKHAARAWRQHNHRIGGIRQTTHRVVVTTGSAASLDHDTHMRGNEVAGVVENICRRGRQGRQLGPLRQRREIQLQHLRLGIDRQHQVEGSGLVGMKDSTGATSQRFPQRLGRMQRVGLADIRGHPSVDALHRFRHLLHIVAFAEGRLVSVDVIDADTVGCCRDRSCQRLQCPGSNRGDDRRRLSVGPSQRGCRMSHLNFVATIDRLGHTFFVIDPQHVADVGGTMTEDGKECSHLLLQEPQNQGFRKRDLYRSRQGTVRQGPVEASSRMNRPRARANL